MVGRYYIFNVLRFKSSSRVYQQREVSSIISRAASGGYIFTSAHANHMDMFRGVNKPGLPW